MSSSFDESNNSATTESESSTTNKLYPPLSRQGDPLYPYLFLLTAEGLSTLLNKEIVEGNLQELHISRHAPGISHLLFADDSLLFVKGTEDQAQVVKI